MDDETFAAAYKLGLVTDSLGNKIDSTRHSLLGPEPPVPPRRKPLTTEHMTSPVGPENAFDLRSNPLEEDDWRELWQPGLKEATADMYRNARVRQSSQQEKKQVVDRAVILAAFKRGFSR